MENSLIKIITTIVPSIVTALIAYMGSRYKGKNEIEQLKHLQESEIVKIKEQQQFEIEKLKESQNAEIEKIREQSLREIERLSVEIDKQAELYEKNKQTDMVASIFEKMMTGDTKSIQNIMEIVKILETKK